MSTIEIVFCTDNNYVMPAGVLMKSISENNKVHDIRFHAIIDESVSEENKKALIDVVSSNKRHVVSFHEVKGSDYDSFPNLGSSFTQTRACYYRLSIADIIPQNIDKLLYLDCDIIVTDDISDLWETDIDGYAVAAVTDEGEDAMDYKTLDYSREYGYFNSGVLLINLSYWRTHCVFSQFIDIIAKHANKMKQHDQEVLNIAFHDKVLHLPFIYNQQEHFMLRPELMSFNYSKYKDEIIDSIKNYKIIHYSSTKPWKGECIHPLKKEFRKYLSLTQWRNFKPRWKSQELLWKMKTFKLLCNLGIKRWVYIDLKKIR